jgi:nucleoid-associated protein YejK
MELKNIVLHQIIREENQESELNLSSCLLEINDITNDFVKKLTKSYTSKSPTYGAFDPDVANNPFQENVRAYFQNKDFFKFSTLAMNTLKSSMNVPQAKGGYVVFAHYTESSKDFIVTVMLDNSERFVVSDDLGIEKLLGLDIDKVARANRINWQEWQDHKETYLSFIKGTRGVSDYFAKKFIGCTDFTSAKQNVKNVESAVSTYMRDNNFSHDEKIHTKARLKKYFDKQVDAKEDITVGAISACIDPSEPTKFMDYVHENEYLKVGNFRSDRKSHFKNFEIKTLKGDGYKLEYSFSSENIELDKENNKIIIKNVPSSEFED